MAILRLGVTARYLSDPVISGFTTGAAVVIITSQITPILGLTIQHHSGLFATVKVNHILSDLAFFCLIRTNSLNYIF